MAESDPGEEFRRLFERSNRDLLAQAFLLTDDRQEAQDLVQEVFLRAWRTWPRVAAMQAPDAWLRCVLHNLAVSRWRSSPATVGASRPNAGFTGTGGRALRRRESASIVAPGTTRSPDLRGGIRPYDRTSGPRDECKRRQCPSMGVARQDEIRTSARSGPRADNGER